MSEVLDLAVGQQARYVDDAVRGGDLRDIAEEAERLARLARRADVLADGDVPASGNETWSRDFLPVGVRALVDEVAKSAGLASEPLLDAVIVAANASGAPTTVGELREIVMVVLALAAGDEPGRARQQRRSGHLHGAGGVDDRVNDRHAGHHVGDHSGDPRHGPRPRLSAAARREARRLRGGAAP